MKKIVASLVALLLTFACLAGCGGTAASSSSAAAPAAGTSDAAAEETPPAASDLKVGLIVSGSVNDNGWCATAYEALLEIEKRFGAQINYVEDISISDIDEQLANYGDEGYSIVFCHGYEYMDGVTKMAPQYPDTWFAVNSTGFDEAPAPNVLAVNQSNFEKGFLAGMIAGAITESGTIGGIGGTDIPPVQLSVQGIEAGAKYMNPDVTVLTTITGDNEDSTAALEVANAMINQNADVLVPVLGSAGLAILTAAEESDILVVGTNSDMHEFGPDVVVNSSVAGFIDSMPTIVQYLVDGTLEAKGYNFGVKEDVVKLVGYYQFADELPQETLDKISAAIDDIKSGKLVPEDLAQQDAA